MPPIFASTKRKQDTPPHAKANTRGRRPRGLGSCSTCCCRYSSQTRIPCATAKISSWKYPTVSRPIEKVWMRLLTLQPTPSGHLPTGRRAVSESSCWRTKTPAVPRQYGTRANIMAHISETSASSCEARRTMASSIGSSGVSRRTPNAEFTKERPSVLFAHVSDLTGAQLRALALSQKGGVHAVQRMASEILASREYLSAISLTAEEEPVAEEGPGNPIGDRGVSYGLSKLPVDHPGYTAVRRAILGTDAN